MAIDRSEALTGLRGIAAWWVVFYHFREALPLTPYGVLDRVIGAGFLAVDLFFVLSGYVICINYAARLVPFSFDSYRNFLIIRLARIYPLHLTVLALGVVTSMAILAFSKSADLGSRYRIDYFLASLLLIQNWGFLTDLAWNIPAWSISTEFFAYLIFPLLLWLINRGSLARLFFYWLLGTAAIIIVFSVAQAGSIGERIGTLGLFRCVAEFFLGMIVAVARLRFPEKFPFIQILAFVIVIVVLIINRVHHLDDFIFIPSVCFCTIAIFAQGSSVFHGILSSRPLLYLGEISYSTYLIHYFSKDWSKFLFSVIGPATFVLYAFTVLVLSVALYYIIEIPGRDFGRKFKIERTS